MNRYSYELARFHQQVEQLLEHRMEWLPALDAATAELPTIGIRRDVQKFLLPLRKEYTADQFLADRDALLLLPLLARGASDEQPRESAMRNWLLLISERYSMRVRRRNAFVYPIILALLSILVFLFVSVFLFPTFRRLFSEQEIRLPSITQSTFWYADQLTIHFARTAVYVAIVAALTYFAVRLWRSQAMTHRIFGRFVSGRTANLFAMSSLISTLAELLNLKAPLPLAMEIAGRCSRHAFYDDAAKQIAKAIQSKLDAATQPIAITRMPPLLLYALRADRDGSPSIPLLRELASLYSDRARARTDWIFAGIPSVAIFVVGMFIANIVIVLFLPMIEMITTLSK